VLVNPQTQPGIDLPRLPPPPANRGLTAKIPRFVTAANSREMKEMQIYKIHGRASLSPGGRDASQYLPQLRLPRGLFAHHSTIPLHVIPLRVAHAILPQFRIQLFVARDKLRHSDGAII
jgi:hypothetical protein